MTATATAHARDSDPGRDVGLALFAAWLLLVVSGFWLLIALPLRSALAQGSDPARAALIAQWWADREGTPSDAPVLWIDRLACSCAEETKHRRAVLYGLESFARRSGVLVVLAGAHETPPPFDAEIVLLDSAGLARYAGPLQPTLFCSGTSTLAAAAIAQPRDEFPALVLPSECPCDVQAHPTASVDAHLQHARPT